MRRDPIKKQCACALPAVVKPYIHRAASQVPNNVVCPSCQPGMCFLALASLSQPSALSSAVHQSLHITTQVPGSVERGENATWFQDWEASHLSLALDMFLSGAVKHEGQQWNQVEHNKTVVTVSIMASQSPSAQSQCFHMSLNKLMRSLVHIQKLSLLQALLPA